MFQRFGSTVDAGWNLHIDNQEHHRTVHVKDLDVQGKFAATLGALLEMKSLRLAWSSWHNARQV